MKMKLLTTLVFVSLFTATHLVCPGAKASDDPGFKNAEQCANQAKITYKTCTLDAKYQAQNSEAMSKCEEDLREATVQCCAQNLSQGSDECKKLMAPLNSFIQERQSQLKSPRQPQAQSNLDYSSDLGQCAKGVRDALEACYKKTPGGTDCELKATSGLTNCCKSRGIPAFGSECGRYREDNLAFMQTYSGQSPQKESASPVTQKAASQPKARVSKLKGGRKKQ